MKNVRKRKTGDVQLCSLKITLFLDWKMLAKRPINLEDGSSTCLEISTTCAGERKILWLRAMPAQPFQISL